MHSTEPEARTLDRLGPKIRAPGHWTEPFSFPICENPRRRKMTTIRRFCCNDLLSFASVNLDHLTETVSFSRSHFCCFQYGLSLNEGLMD